MKFWFSIALSLITIIAVVVTIGNLLPQPVRSQQAPESHRLLAYAMAGGFGVVIWFILNRKNVEARQVSVGALLALVAIEGGLFTLVRMITP